MIHLYTFFYHIYNCYLLHLKLMMPPPRWLPPHSLFHSMHQWHHSSIDIVALKLPWRFLYILLIYIRIE